MKESSLLAMNAVAWDTPGGVKLRRGQGDRVQARLLPVELKPGGLKDRTTVGTEEVGGLGSGPTKSR